MAPTRILAYAGSILGAIIVVGIVGGLGKHTAPGVAPGAGETGGSNGAQRQFFLNSELDIGTLAWYRQADFRLVFANPRNEALQIATVKTGCGCTVIDSARYSGATVALALMRLSTAGCSFPVNLRFEPINLNQSGAGT